MKNLWLFLAIGICLLGIVQAEGDLGTVKRNTCIDLYQYCPTCSWVNLTAVKYPDGLINFNVSPMTKSGYNFNVSFCDTDQLGKYFYTACGDKNEIMCEDMSFEVSSTGGDGYTFWIILIFLFAFTFLILSTVVNEELFVYISGVCFLVAGVVIMVNGINTLNDWTTRAISFVSLGLGFLFSMGAYIYNSYKKSDSEEEY